MQLAVDEDAGIEICLGAVTEGFVFLHDTGIGVGDGAELLLRGALVAVDFVVDFGLRSGRGHELLDHHEVGSGKEVS